MFKDLTINTYEDNILLFKENLTGKLENNILKFENDTDSFTIDLNKLTFKKENLDSLLTITPKRAIIIIKEIKKSFDIKLNKHLFLKIKNKIIIEYLLESQDQPIKLEIEMSDIDAHIK